MQKNISLFKNFTTIGVHKKRLLCYTLDFKKF